MRIMKALLLSMSIAATPILGEEIHQVQGLEVKLASIKTLAILPIEPCPGALDCEKIESSLVSAIYELKQRSPWKPVVFSSKKVKQDLFTAGREEAPTDSEGLIKLATTLGVEGFLIPKIPYLGSIRRGPTLVTAEDDATEARVELEVFLVSSEPQVVFRGKDQGQDTSWSTPANYVGGMLKGLVAHVFPKR